MTQVATTWQAIDNNAPKDGTPILAYCPTAGEFDRIYVVRWASLRPATQPYWQEAGGEEYAPYYPTHWMHLPPPP